MSDEPQEIWMPKGWEVLDGTIPVDRQAEHDDVRYVRHDHLKELRERIATLEAKNAALHAQIDRARDGAGKGSLVQNCTIDLRGAGYLCVDQDGDTITGLYGEGDKVMIEGDRVHLDGLHILGPAAVAELTRNALEKAAKKAKEKCEQQGQYRLSQACYDAILALRNGDA